MNRAWDDRTFDILVPGTVFERCAFQQCVFQKNVADVTFRQCTFANTRFLGSITDTVFVDTTVHEGRFERRFVDCTWTQCALTRVRGPWHALRTTLRQCTLAACTPDRHATWRQCRLDRDTRMVETSWEAAVFTDTVVADTVFERCCLDRVTWTRTTGRRTTFEACGNHNAVFGGNRWHACAWTRCGGTHARHVSDHHVKSRVVACRRQHARFLSTTFDHDVQDDTLYDHAEWDRCGYTGSTWRRVHLRHATLDRVTFLNVLHLDVDTTDTTYRNVVRRAPGAVDVTVHRHNTAEPHTVTVTLFRDRTAVHGPVTVHDTDTPTTVPAALARGIEFVHVHVVPPWYTLGLSVPSDAHHLVPHVTVGPITFYADKKPYRPADRRGVMVGYRRRSRARAHSR